MSTTKTNPKVPVVPAYTITAAAAALGVSDETVRNWVRAGKLEAAKLEGGELQLVTSASVQAAQTGAA